MDTSSRQAQAFAFVADDGFGLHTLAVFQRFVDADGNRGQSLVIEHTVETFVRVRLSTVQEEMITWEISADAGARWQEVAPDGN